MALQPVGHTAPIFGCGSGRNQQGDNDQHVIASLT
jgi:hypothetical protein